MVQQCLYVLPGLPRDESDRTISHRRERFTNVTNPALGWHLARELVPFVHNEDTRLELVGDVVSKLLVYFAHLLFAIEEQQNNIRATDATLCSVNPVPIDVCLDAFIASQTWRIDGHKFMPIEFKLHVDAIAGRSGNFADDHSLCLGERIDKRALAYIATTDDSHLHHGRFQRFSVKSHIRQTLNDEVEQHIFVSILLNTYQR